MSSAGAGAGAGAGSTLETAAALSETELRAELQQTNLQIKAGATGAHLALLQTKRSELQTQLSLLASGNVHAMAHTALSVPSSPMSARSGGSFSERDAMNQSVGSLQRALSGRKLYLENSSKRFSTRDLFGDDGQDTPARRYKLTRFERVLCGSYARQAVAHAMQAALHGDGRPASTSVPDAKEHQAELNALGHRKHSSRSLGSSRAGRSPNIKAVVGDTAAAGSAAVSAASNRAADSARRGVAAASSSARSAAGSARAAAAGAERQAKRAGSRISEKGADMAAAGASSASATFAHGYASTKSVNASTASFSRRTGEAVQQAQQAVEDVQVSAQQVRTKAMNTAKVVPQKTAEAVSHVKSTGGGGRCLIL